jgi:hypothetical protein
MSCAYSKVLTFCPEHLTGGPEALHQLAYMIRRQGGSSGMVYTGPKSHAYFDHDRLICVFSPESTVEQYFAAYSPEVARETQLDDGTLLVYPEIMTRQAQEWPGKEFGVRRAVWWLSVASAFHCNDEFENAAYREHYFADPSIMHFYQSAHAREFLRANKALNFYPLFDFTDQDFVHQSQVVSDFAPIDARDNAICFFPRKGGPLASLFAQSADWESLGVKFVPIQDMSKAEVRHTLFRAKLYIDFGPHPGKDRTPREAAIAGAIVLLLGAGAARQFEDHPLDPYYVFDEPDIVSGQLRDKVLHVLADCRRHYENQRIYRQSILLEREQFAHQVRRWFFTGPR